MTDPDDWPDWKKLIAKLAILWCAFSGLCTLVMVLGYGIRWILS